jgi:single-strand DNA-binding protein
VTKVILPHGRLNAEPTEMRSLAMGKNVTTFTVASNELPERRREKAEYSNVGHLGPPGGDRRARILGKGQQVAVEGRLQTRSWDDERGQRHWKTEVVASHVEILSGRRKKDYEAVQAADSLVAQAERYGEAPPTEPIPDDAEAALGVDIDDEDDAEGAAA